MSALREDLPALRQDAGKPGRYDLDPASPLRDRDESDAHESRAELYALPDGAPAPRRGPFVLLMVLLLGGGLAGLLLLNTQLQQNSFTLQSLQQQQATLDDTAQVLSQQVDEMQAPQVIQSAAAAMGLVPAQNPRYLDLRTGKLTSGAAVTAVPRAPSAAEVARARAAAAARTAREKAAALAEARVKAQAKAQAAAHARAQAAALAAARAKASASAAARPSSAPGKTPGSTAAPTPPGHATPGATR